MPDAPAQGSPLTALLVGLVTAAALTASYLVLRHWRSGQPLIPTEPRWPVPWKLEDVLLVALIYLAAQSGMLYVLAFLSGAMPDLEQLRPKANVVSPVAATRPTELAAAQPTEVVSVAESQAADSSPGNEVTPSPRLLTVLMAANVLANLLTLAASIAWLWWRYRATWQDLGLTTARLGRDLKWGALGFLCTVIPVLGLQAVLTHWFPSQHPIATLLEQFDHWSVLLLCTVAAVIAAPLVEEFLFRVILQGWLEKVAHSSQQAAAGWTSANRFPPLLQLPGSPVQCLDVSPRLGWPLFVSAGLFAAIHLGHGPDPLPLFLFALLLGYLYRRTHRLWSAVTAHALLNSFSMATLWLELLWRDPTAK